MVRGMTPRRLPHFQRGGYLMGGGDLWIVTWPDGWKQRVAPRCGLCPRLPQYTGPNFDITKPIDPLADQVTHAHL